MRKLTWRSGSLVLLRYIPNASNVDVDILNGESHYYYWEAWPLHVAIPACWCKTNWPDIVEMGKEAPRLIGALRDHFCCTAVPDFLWSDGGPQFTSHLLANFLQTWGVKHAVHHLQNNGKAESTVKSMKKLISAVWTGRSINWDTLSHVLLQYRNTPCCKGGCPKTNTKCHLQDVGHLRDYYCLGTQQSIFHQNTE
jgi:hypothetical protein